MNVPYELFWHLNPRKLKPFIEANKMRKDSKNEDAWIQGLYVKAALDSTVGNMFKRESDEPNKYPEKPYPIFSDNKNSLQEGKEPTEEEKIEFQKQLLTKLQIMESNFKTCN